MTLLCAWILYDYNLCIGAHVRLESMAYTQERESLLRGWDEPNLYQGAQNASYKVNNLIFAIR